MRGAGICGNSSAVERQPSKLGVAGSNPVSRSIVAMALGPARGEGGLFEVRVAPTRRVYGHAAISGLAPARQWMGGRSTEGAREHGQHDAVGSAHVAQMAEHALGKGEVSGSIPDMGSRYVLATKRGAHGR